MIGVGRSNVSKCNPTTCTCIPKKTDCANSLSSKCVLFILNLQMLGISGRLFWRKSVLPLLASPTLSSGLPGPQLYRGRERDSSGCWVDYVTRV